MHTQPPRKPQIDPAELHNCGTLHRAGVITAGCPGCRQHDSRTRTA